MFIKNNIKLFKNIINIFLINFLLIINFLFLGIRLLNFKVYFLNSDAIVYIGVIPGIFAFLLWFKKLNKKNIIRILILEIILFIFLTFLIIIIMLNLNFNYLNLSKNLYFLLIFLTIIFGYISFSEDREIVEDNNKKQKNIEDKQKKLNIINFNRKFKEINTFNFDKYLSNNFNNKKWYKILIKILASSFIYIGRVPYKIIKWIYIEGYKYSISLIMIIIGGIILRLFLANKLIISVDEIEATYSLIKGFLDYHQFGLLQTGVPYQRSVIFAFLSGFGFLFPFSEIVQLRFFSIISSAMLIFAICNLLNYLKISKKIIFLLIIIINFNWQFVLYTIAARSYGMFIILYFISIILIYKLYKTNFNLKYLLYFILITLINFLEGHSVLALSIFFPFIIILFYSLKNISRKKILYILLGTILFSIVLFLSYPSVFTYIISKLSFNFVGRDWTELLFYFSSFSYFFIIGFIFFIIGILVQLKNIFKFPYLLIFYSVIIIPIFQILFSDKLLQSRYISYALIPFLILGCIIYFEQIFYGKKIILKLISLFFIFIMFCTSIYNFYNIYEKKIGWQSREYKNWDTLLSKVPYSSIIITDFPNNIIFQRKDTTVYFIRDRINDYAVINKNGLYINETTYKNDIKNINPYFNNFLSKINLSSYITIENQNYHFSSGVPKIMNKEHLNNIISSSKNHSVYFILSHNFYDKINQENNTELYKYIINNIYYIDIISQKKYESSNLEMYDDEKNRFYLGKMSI